MRILGEEKTQTWGDACLARRANMTKTAKDGPQGACLRPRPFNGRLAGAGRPHGRGAAEQEGAGQRIPCQEKAIKGRPWLVLVRSSQRSWGGEKKKMGTVDDL